MRILHVALGLFGSPELIALQFSCLADELDDIAKSCAALPVRDSRDEANTWVRSRAVGERVMRSVARFLEDQLHRHSPLRKLQSCLQDSNSMSAEGIEGG